MSCNVKTLQQLFQERKRERERGKKSLFDLVLVMCLVILQTISHDIEEIFFFFKLFDFLKQNCIKGGYAKC